MRTFQWKSLGYLYYHLPQSPHPPSPFYLLQFCRVEKYYLLQVRCGSWPVPKACSDTWVSDGLWLPWGFSPAPPLLWCSAFLAA